MPVVIQIDAYDPVLPGTVTLRMASDDSDLVCHLNGQTWWPVLDRLPLLAMDFFGGEFGQVTTAAASMSLSVEPWPDFARYAFPDARLQLWHGDYGAAWAGYTLRFDGRVTAQPVIEDGRAQIGFAVDDKWLDTPLLSTYAGTGSAEGPAAAKGTPKPLAIGAPMGVPGVMLDPIKSIIQLSAYGAIESVDVPLERLARQFGSPLADYASYAALDAATVPAGQWATCKAAGLVRMGAPPYGKLCFLMKGDKGGADGWVRRPGAIIKRLASIAGGSAKVSETAVDALDTARPYDISLYYDGQISARQAIQDVAASVNAVAGVSLTGQLITIPVQINATGLTYRADGSTVPMVSSVRSLGISAPWWRLAIGAQPFWDVHSQGDYIALQITNAFPEPPPGAAGLPGHIYVDENKRQYRYLGGSIFSDEGDIIGADGLISSSGYEDIQDLAIPAAQATASSALTAATDAIDRLDDIDDDSVITIDEKIRILIPEDARLEGSYTALIALAATANVSILAAQAARADWQAALNFMSPAWNDTSSNSDVNRANYDSALTNYRNALSDLSTAVTEAIPAAVAPDLTGNFTWAISADVTGAITTSLPTSRRFTATQGVTDVSPSTNFELVGVTTGLVLTVNNTVSSADRGVASIGAGTTNGGTATLRATLPGGGVIERVITVTKNNALPATGGGSGATFAQDTSFSNITSTSHAAISDELVCRSDGSGNIRLSIDLYYSGAGGTASRTPSFKASYATTSGGSLTDLFSEASGSSCIGGTEPEDGYYVRAEATFAMPAPNTDYYFKLQGRRSSGTGNISFNGTSFTVRQ